MKKFIETKDIFIEEISGDITSDKTNVRVGSFDLSLSTEMASAVIEYLDKENEKIAVDYMNWMPKNKYKEAVGEYKNMLDIAIDKGRLKIVNDNFVHRKNVIEWFVSYHTKGFKIGINPYFDFLIKRDLEELGFETVEVKHCFVELSQPMRHLKELFLNRNVMMEDDIIFYWFMNNVYETENNCGMIVPIKQLPKKFIFGFNALLTCHSVVFKEY